MRPAPEVGVLGVVPDRWDAPWMPRHHILSRLANYFQVAWLEPPPHWRELLRSPGRFRLRSREPRDGLTVVSSDFFLPAFHRPASLADRAFRARLRRGRRALVERGCRRTVLYLWRFEFAPALDAVPHDLSCYHIDDEYTFSEEERPIPPPERELLGRVDQVFIHSPALLEKKGGINPHTAFVPNGVDYQAFAERQAEPGDLVRIPRPRMGYAGMLKRQLDWPLLRELAARHPDWQFVYVGGRSPHPELEPHLQALKARSNVHFLGAKEVDELPVYPQHFDVCLMPYRVDGYTKYIYPLKLHEYLASGRPVVSSPIRSVREFSEVVSLASTAEEWSAALERALSPAAGGAAARQARQQVAQRHDWDELVLRVARTIGARLNLTRGDRSSPGT